MKTLTGKDIISLCKSLKESLSVFVGKDDDRRCLIKPGLKLTHKKSGFNYTVVDVQTEEDDIFINCYRADSDSPGVFLRLNMEDLKEFERL